MNIVCEATQETINAATEALNNKIQAITTAAGNGCTRTEAALLAALDLATQNIHQSARVKELEEFLHRADPTGDNFEASMLRGENETLRAELQVKNGVYDALLQDNATLFRLNAKLIRQNTETNARADRMHDQVLSMLTEVRELREKLAAMCVDTREPVLNYQNYEQAPDIEITPEEQQVTQKYEQMDPGDLFGSNRSV
jgi:hypothetical protein